MFTRLPGRPKLISVAILLFAACSEPSAPAGTPAPESVIATAAHGQINITWRDLTNNKAKYEVEYSYDAAAWVPLKSGVGITSAVQLGVEYETKYYYRVRACIATDCSGWAQTSTEWTGALAPEIVNVGALPGNVGVSLSGHIDHGGLRTIAYFIITSESGEVIRAPEFIVTPRVPGLQEATPIQRYVYGLQEGKSYTFTLTATNGAGTTQWLGAFKTSVTGPPIVSLNITKPDAIAPVADQRLGANVDPGGLTTQTWFELTTRDSSFTSAPHYPSSTLTSAFISSVSVTLPVLRAGTSYKWRAAASNTLGTTYSDSVFFKTQ